MSLLVYFSSSSENTHRFIARVGLPAVRIPLNERERIQVDEPFILVVPSYGGGGTAGAVPRQAIRFLNDPQNRSYLRGVIAAGNTNFGAAYGIAGDIIAKKCQVPFLYRFELLGTTQDVANVRQGVTAFWQRQNRPGKPPARWITILSTRCSIFMMPKAASSLIRIDWRHDNTSCST